MENHAIIALLPFVLAIFFALWQKDVVFPLLGGLFIGSFIASKFNPLFGFLNTAGTFIAGALSENFHVMTLLIIAEGIVLFTILNANGFITGFMETLPARFWNRTSLEITAALSSIVLFIDRHLGALLVGIFTRPLSLTASSGDGSENGQKTSPEKERLASERLSYLINTASSSVATLIPFTTLTPVAVAGIGAAFVSLGIGYSPLKVFYRSIPYQFYNIFALFILMSTLLLKKDLLIFKKEISSASRTDRKANLIRQANLMGDFVSLGCSVSEYNSSENPVEASPSARRNAFYGFTGAAAVVFITIIAGLFTYRGGYETLAVLNVQNLQTLFVMALFSGIMFSTLFALVTKTKTYTSLKEIKKSFSNRLVVTFVYIVLAMSFETLAAKTGLLTSISGSLKAGAVSPSIIPLIIFIISVLISFTSGSMLFTVSAVLPIAIRAASRQMTDPMIVDELVFATVGAVLSGASFGDANSPLSLTFIISSAASEASVSGHFKTQIGYSAMAFLLTLTAGYMLFLLNLKPYISLAAGFLLAGITFLVFYGGKGLSELFR